jgi:hypothetical protein
MMQDILRQVEIHVHCDECEDSYVVPASLVAESYALLDEGCSGTSAHECAPSFYASLVDRSMLDALARAWRDVSRNAAAQAMTIAVRSRPKLAAIHHDEEARSLCRWEDDGGPARAEAA